MAQEQQVEAPILNESGAVFRNVWAVGAIIATVFAAPIVIWGRQYPWIIAIPVVIGVGLTLYLEFRTPLEVFEAQGTVSTLPPEFQALGNYRKKIGLYIEETDVPAEQMDLFGAPQSTTPAKRRVIKMRDDKGREFTLVECDRFLAKVNHVIESDVKKAAEHAFLTGWKRLEQLVGENPQLRELMSDPLFLEAVKNDFHGNVSICMARSGQRAITEFLEDAKLSEKVEQYRLTAEKSRSAHKGRSNA